MNPLDWKREHQIALGLAIVIGAAVGVILGYFTYAAASGFDGGVSFGDWVRHPVRYAWLWWGIFGAAIGVGVLYFRRLTSN